MYESPYWWPLDLDAEEDRVFCAFRDRMQDEPVELDRGKAKNAVDLLALGMRNNIERVVADDRLPSLCHMLNGWGDMTWKGSKLSADLRRFVAGSATGRPFIPQMHPEGDFHPWQTIAYAVMAGVDGTKPLFPGGPSLCALARGSRELPKRDGDELGHLLYAFAALDPDPQATFRLNGEWHTVGQIVEMAMDAHHVGSFRVCRKIHLTEGLCAIASQVEGFGGYREAAQGFLDGQLDILFALGALIEESLKLHDRRLPPREGSMVERLRDKLVLDSFFENHTYLAGHLLELACLAHGLGYTVSPRHRSAMAYLANALNDRLPSLVGSAVWPKCFLHFGHYRRGLSLLAFLEESNFMHRGLSRAELSAFSVDFDALAPAPLPGRPPEEELQVFTLEHLEDRPRDAFAEVIAQCEALVPEGFVLRGSFPHFRRTAPPDWPRQLHYEILDHDHELAVEFHIEDAALKAFVEPLRREVPKIAAQFSDARVEWDQRWFEGRLRIRFRDDARPERIAQALVELIRETSPWLSRSYAELQRNSGSIQESV